MSLGDVSCSLQAAVLLCIICIAVVLQIQVGLYAWGGFIFLMLQEVMLPSGQKQQLQVLKWGVRAAVEGSVFVVQ